MCNNHVIHGRLEEDVINDLLSSFDLIFIRIIQIIWTNILKNSDLNSFREARENWSMLKVRTAASTTQAPQFFQSFRAELTHYHCLRES